MNKFILAAAVALLSSTAIAQEAIDRTPNALPAQNFGIIAESRLFYPVQIPTFTGSISTKVVAPMAGVVQEMWVLPVNADGTIDKNTWFYVSISRKNGLVQPICQANTQGLVARGGNGANGQCTQGVTMAEGDALIVSAQPTATLGATIPVNVMLRIADR